MRAFTSFKIPCKEFLFNISNTKPQVLKVKLGLDSHAKSLAVTRVWLHMSGRHWQETSESPAMAPYVTSSWNRITVTRPDTFWQHVGKLLCTLQNVSPVIQQCRFYWRDKTHLCSLKDKESSLCVASSSQGIPDALTVCLLGPPLVDAISLSLCCLQVPVAHFLSFYIFFPPSWMQLFATVCP